MGSNATMRMMLALAALGAALFFYVPPSQAYYGSAPWCAVVDTGWDNMEEECIYNSIEECRPHVIAGNRGFCSENPRWPGWYAPQAEAPVKHKRRIRRY
jgi:Protein of unknown function (DUF3551)